MSESFPLIRLTGSPEQRGASHGHQLQEKIAATIEFYGHLLNIKEREVLDIGRYFQQQIQRQFPAYCEEIEALASAAEQIPEWIYVLNARSELISQSLECSTLTFRDACLLGQNWDFCETLQDLAVLLHITLENGHQLLTLTEPGIIGKLGMNSRGLGCCVNMLHYKRRCEGIPLHIVLRSLLEATSLEQARELAFSLPGSRVGSITAANNQNQSFCIEYAGERSWFLSPPGRINIHTNHYLGHRLNPESGAYQNSYERLRTLARLTSIFTTQNLHTMFRLLSDRSNPVYPVNRPCQTNDFSAFGNVGTLATVVMELSTGVLHIRKGNDLGEKIISYPVVDSQQSI
ncbi:C45 family autoproteolytic acyltransferase/hydolase [Parendozoicomonas haliclonae]|uniref:Acyl-coenzyme A:6-aminopenicillanic acid acyl-transferase n=1 Tax=Parendozoicomonas haliclonae TaxID=1960125 RepID=A0A1X7ANW6_9GAMM|nr:C45 family peptidase [Parendozoicomonas haliclonae]SMA49780.1 Acyl-coenzyme A:6-aminopenicillanic acid acyl-transferase [Parendozoicomonas haliclonae]